MKMPKEVRLLAGTDRPVREAMEPFAPQALDFFDALSRALRARSTDPETVAFAFWCRRAHLRSLQKKHGIADPMPMRLGRGRIFYLAPANVPMMFAYTWAIGLLAGNAGIVRISERTLRLESVQQVLETLQSLFARGDGGSSTSCLDSSFDEIRIRSSFITYDHSDAVTEEILSHCDGRVLWGGDETIRQMRRIPMPAHAVELAFPDRVSIAVIDEKALQNMQEEDLCNLVHRFYNDTYVMDQNGCSSPQTVIWLQDQQPEYLEKQLRQPEHPEEQLQQPEHPEEQLQEPECPDDQTQRAEHEEVPGSHTDPEIETSPCVGLHDKMIREKWWRLLAREAEQEYENDGFRAARKLEKAALAAMRGGEASEPGDKGKTATPSIREAEKSKAPEVTSIRRFGGNALYVLHLDRLPQDLAAYKGGFGLFYEAETESPEKIFDSFSDRIQTIVCIGTRPERLAASALQAHSPGVLRFVEAGQALQMDTFWDGMDLIEALSRRILL